MFVSVTRLRIRSIFYVPQFCWYAVRSRQRAQRAPGLVAGRVMREVRNAFWTMTAWENEAAMEAFRIQSAHRDAMLKLLDWCDEASLAHWTQESRELPSWQEAYEQLIKDGRPSKVRHPSAAHWLAPRPGRLFRAFGPASAKPRLPSIEGKTCVTSLGRVG